MAENAILAGEEHAVTDSAEKDEIEKPFLLAGFDDALLDESLGEFEGDADTGEIL